MALKRQSREPEKRTSRMRFRISPREKAAIRERAATARMDVSAFVRISAEHAKIHRKADPEALAAMEPHRVALARLGEGLKLWLSGQAGPEFNPAATLAAIQEEIQKLAEAVERV